MKYKFMTLLLMHNPEGSDTQGGVSKAESDDDETVHVSVRTEDLMEDRVTKAFCHNVRL